MSEHVLKHRKISKELTDAIRSGQLPRHAKLPGEHSLAVKYEVSRNTVRQAIAELQKAGLVETRAGAGSFVTYDERGLDVRLGWSRALAEQGVAARARILRFEVAVEPELAAELELDDDRFIALDRLWLDGDRPVSVARSRLPLRPELEGLPAAGLFQDSLTATLREAGIAPWFGDEWLQLVKLAGDDAGTLQREVGEPFFSLRRLVRERGGSVVESVVSLLDPAHFRLHLSFGEGLDEH